METHYEVRNAVDHSHCQRRKLAVTAFPFADSLDRIGVDGTGRLVGFDLIWREVTYLVRRSSRVGQGRRVLADGRPMRPSVRLALAPLAGLVRVVGGLLCLLLVHLVVLHWYRRPRHHAAGRTASCAAHF
jgi:hypothetical protein